MSYIHNAVIDPELIRTAALKELPFGPGFTEEELTGAISLVIECSSINDPGDDWNKFTLNYANGTNRTVSVGGY